MIITKQKTVKKNPKDFYLEGSWWVIYTQRYGEGWWLADKSKTEDFWTQDFNLAQIFYEKWRAENTNSKLIYSVTYILNKNQCVDRWPRLFGLCPHCRKPIK